MQPWRVDSFPSTISCNFLLWNLPTHYFQPLIWISHTQNRSYYMKQLLKSCTNEWTCLWTVWNLDSEFCHRKICLTKSLDNSFCPLPGMYRKVHHLFPSLSVWTRCPLFPKMSWVTFTQQDLCFERFSFFLTGNGFTSCFAFPSFLKGKASIFGTKPASLGPCHDHWEVPKSSDLKGNILA